ncbi:MAG: tRNA lysidine(34) synthetase TilS [Bacteroidales bacterium]|nr:tRNA lysidine(34) synthetase TilS [Bacteroidales bacterium]
MEQERLIDKQKGVLVAISGGADSVVLLHYLVSNGYYCIAAHCNFHLRGEESDRDEQFVRQFCDELSVPLHVAHFETKQYAENHKLSIEMAARELRYGWFFKIMEQEQLPCVAVAHHSDDAVETFLLNLVRGTGIRGLTGMKPKQGRVVRPLLGYSRQDIELYCRAHKLKYVTDSTNLSDAYTRNRLRHNVVPQLKAINPSFLSTMRGNMAHLDQIFALFDAQVKQFAKRAVVEVDGQTLIAMEHLKSLPMPEPFLFELLFVKGFNSDAIRKMARCVEEERWGRIFFSPKHRAIVDRYNIVVTTRDKEVENREFDIERDQLEVFSPIHISLRLFEKTDDFQFSRDANWAHLNADKLYYPLTLRRWRNGDVFRPLGMKGFKKLSDFFVDQKMSRAEKENIWVLESGGEIVWIVGHRIDDRFKVVDNCKEVLEMKLISSQLSNNKENI